MYYCSSTATTVIDDSDAETSNGPAFFQLSEVRLYTVCGIIAALLLLAIIQIICTMYKTRRTTGNQKVR